jgi:hypothetical protein
MGKVSIEDRIEKGERLLKELDELVEKGIYTFSEGITMKFNIHQKLVLLKNIKRCKIGDE